jgi:hypothetical protein
MSCPIASRSFARPRAHWSHKVGARAHIAHQRESRTGLAAYARGDGIDNVTLLAQLRADGRVLVRFCLRLVTGADSFSSGARACSPAMVASPDVLREEPIPDWGGAAG